MIFPCRNDNTTGRRAERRSWRQDGGHGDGIDPDRTAPLYPGQRHPVGHVGGSALRHVRHQKDDWQAVPSAGAVLPPAAAQAWWRRRRAAGDGQHSAGVRGSIHGWRGHWHRHGRNRGCGALLALPHRARGRQRRQPRAAVAPRSRWFVQRHVRAAGCVATVAQRAGTPPFPCTSMRQSCVFDVVA